MKPCSSGHPLPTNIAEYPNLRGNENARLRTAACPFAGGNDRIQIYPFGRNYKGVQMPPGIWCRTCQAQVDLGECKPVPANFVRAGRREPKINPALADIYHKRLTDDRRGYLRRRGITDEVIDAYKLGWRGNRYSIPCFYEDKLYAIQYRIAPEFETEGVKRYISESGGVNDILFNEIVTRARPIFVLVDESPADALALTAHGFPCVAGFAGNNCSHTWRPEWNKHIRHTPERIVIWQRDGGKGESIALAKANDIGNARLIPAPEGFKDIGQFLEHHADKSFDEKQMLLARWLKLPPILVRAKHTP